MKKNILLSLIALLPIAVLSNEPSAYGSNEPQNNSRNGITSNQRQMFQNNENVSATKQPIVKEEASEQYEGVRSIMEGYGSKIAKMDERIRSLEKENNELKEYVAESRKLQNENQEKIKIVLGELGSLIDSINKNYVPKDKFDQLANEVRGKTPSKGVPAETTKKETSKESTAINAKNLSTKDSATLNKEADDLYAKKSYADATILYDELLKRNYKPAKVNFNLGEIAYTQKSYASAIEYYKKSISLFDKASYTPTLLYNTAFSLEKLGKAQEAKSFYKALKEGYPDSPEAKKVK